MKKNIIDNIWQYEIIKNDGIGLAGYGYTLHIYKNDIEILKQGGFGCISSAQSYARDYFLLYEFNVERESEN